MKNQSHEKHIEHQFDSYCKKTLKMTARDYLRRERLRELRIVSLSELPEHSLSELSVTDEYFKDEYEFDVQGHTIFVTEPFLAAALMELPEDRRDILLLAYFLDKNDREIAEQLHLVRRTVSYRKVSALLKLKKILEG